LAEVGSSKAKFDILIERIKKRRGFAAGDLLADNIRKEWKAKRQKPRRAKQ
jgi:hypothetical protein